MSLRNREHLLILLSKCWWVAHTWFSFSKKVSSVTVPGLRHSSSSMARIPFVFWAKGDKRVSFLPRCIVLIIIPNYAIKHNRLSHKKIPFRHNKEQRIKTSNKSPPTEISPLPAGSQVRWGVGREGVSARVSPTSP